MTEHVIDFVISYILVPYSVVLFSAVTGFFAIEMMLDRLKERREQNAKKNRGGTLRHELASQAEFKMDVPNHNVASRREVPAQRVLPDWHHE